AKPFPAAQIEERNAGGRNFGIAPSEPVRVQAPALVPSEYRHVAGQTLLICKALALVLAEESHGLAARQQLAVLRLLVAAISQLGESEPTPREGVAQRLEEFAFVPRTLPSN